MDPAPNRMLPGNLMYSRPWRSTHCVMKRTAFEAVEEGAKAREASGREVCGISPPAPAEGPVR
ncbi:hypothetical protein ARTHRO9AX_150185 [Arthrobacter sp. 9AX]|nr:hypothetical protein ARTHRO9AX_150185 [Arthrobacter sp. 9AX]